MCIYPPQVRLAEEKFEEAESRARQLEQQVSTFEGPANVSIFLRQCFVSLFLLRTSKPVGLCYYKSIIT